MSIGITNGKNKILRTVVLGFVFAARENDDFDVIPEELINADFNGFSWIGSAI